MIHTICRWLSLATCAVPVALATLVFVNILKPARASDSIRTVALSGTPAPSDPSVSLLMPRMPVINNLGQTAFRATLAGMGVDSSNDESLWSEGSGQLEMPVREGMPAPGAPQRYTFTRLYFTDEDLDDQGTLHFAAEISGAIPPTPTIRRSLWKANDSGLQLVARPGAEAPAGPRGVIFDSLDPAETNDVGQTAFRASVFELGSSTSKPGFWLHDSHTLRPILVAGDSLPANEGTARMTEGTTPPDVNASGTLTFRAQARRPDNTLFQGIWSGDSSSLNLIAYTGQVAPGTLPGVFFISFIGAPFNNDAGHTTFKARLQGVGIDDTNESGIWSDASGGLYPVALAGQLAPGTSGGIVFDGFVQDPKFNNLGQVAFRGRLAGPQVRPENADGFWIKTASGLQLIARAGDAAPGVEPGIRFGRFAQFSHPVLNNEGSLAFHANLSGGGNDEGLWAGRPGDMRLLLRTGDVLDVDDTDAVDLRIIESLHIKDAGLGGTAFNDLGQLAFSAQFTDGSWGVFVMNTGLVPEPSSLATLSVILLCGVYFARRRSMARSRIWSENQAPARTTTRQLRS